MDRLIDKLVDALQDGEISRRQFVESALRLGLTASATGTLLAACGASAGPSGSNSPSAKLSGTVQILVGFGTGNTPAQIPAQEALAQAFMQRNPDVKIEFLRFPQDAQTKFTTLVAGGTPPALVLPTGASGIASFLDQDVWLDLAPYFSRDGISLDQFVPEAAAAVHVPSFYGKSSRVIVGVPAALHDHALAYNPDLVAKAGVAPPPTSWSDNAWAYQSKFLETAQALTVDRNGKHAGQSGFDPNHVDHYGLGHYFREGIFFAFGGRYYDAPSRRAQFDQPASIEGIQFASDLINRYHVQPDQTQVATLGAGAEKGNEEQFAWKAGKLAMIDMCSCDITGGFGTNVPFAWKSAAIPTGPARRFVFLNLDLGAIVKPSQNHDLSWEVLKWFTVDASNEKKLSYGSYAAIPPLKQNSDAFSAGIKHDYPSVDPSNWYNGLPFAANDNQDWFPAYSEVHDLINTAFDKITAGTSAAPVMRQLQTDAQAKIDAWLKTHSLPG